MLDGKCAHEWNLLFAWNIPLGCRPWESRDRDSGQFGVDVAACPLHVWEWGRQPFLCGVEAFSAPLLIYLSLWASCVDDIVHGVRACPLTVWGLLLQKPSKGVLGSIWNNWRPLWGLFQKPLQACILTHHQMSQMWPLAPSQRRPWSQEPAIWSVYVMALGTLPPASLPETN